MCTAAGCCTLSFGALRPRGFITFLFLYILMNFHPGKVALSSSAIVFLLWGCSGKPDSTAAPAAPGAAAASASAPAAKAASAAVTTTKAQKRDLNVTLHASGTVISLNVVDVRPQVSSTVKVVHFKEGQFVKAGQLLFTLDARSDEANLVKAQAQQAKDNATLADATRQLERSKQLYSQKFISQGAVDTAQATMEAATATVAADQAAIEAAKVAVSYSRIVAPNSGRAGAVTVYPGSAVQANLTTLVTITQLDPVGVQYSIPQRNLGDALQALTVGASVTATLADAGGTFKGRLQFVDNNVDASSGAVKAKAVFENKENKLWPGAFVEVQQVVGSLKDAVVIPLASIVQGARGAVVYVVQSGKAVLKPIKVVYSEGEYAAVTGIEPGDAVVQEGKENLRPDAPVLEHSKDGQAATAPAVPASAEAPKP